MSDRETTADPKVGYCKPPVHTRWKRGQSGNRKGRPKATKSGQTDVAEVLGEPLTVKQAGTTRKMTPFEVSVRQLVKRALNKNDLKAVLEFVRLCESYGLILLRSPLNKAAVCSWCRGIGMNGGPRSRSLARGHGRASDWACRMNMASVQLRRNGDGKSQE